MLKWSPWEFEVFRLTIAREFILMEGGGAEDLWHSLVQTLSKIHVSVLMQTGHLCGRKAYACCTLQAKCNCKSYLVITADDAHLKYILMYINVLGNSVSKNHVQICRAMVHFSQATNTIYTKNELRAVLGAVWQAWFRLLATWCSTS